MRIFVSLACLLLLVSPTVLASAEVPGHYLATAAPSGGIYEDNIQLCTAFLNHRVKGKIRKFDVIRKSSGSVRISEGKITRDGKTIAVRGRELKIPAGGPGHSNWQPFFVFFDGIDVRLSADFPKSKDFIPLHLLFKRNDAVGVLDLRGGPDHRTEVDAEWFGCGAAPGADDTTRIAGVLDATRALGGGTVYFRAATYRVRGNLRLCDNTTLIFGEKTKVTLADGSECSYVFGGDNVKNITIAGGVFDGNKTKQKVKNLGFIHSKNECRGWKIESVKIANNLGHGIYFEKASDITLKKVTVEDVDGLGIGIFRGDWNVTVDACLVRNVSSNGIEVYGLNSAAPYRNVSITDTEVVNSKGQNVALVHVAGGSVAHCRLHDCARYSGLFCQDCQHLTVSGNVIRDNWDGILLNNGSSGNLIDNNIITNNEQDGIDICYGGGKDNVVSNNTLDYNGIWGIYLLEADRNTIKDNILRDNGLKAAKHNTHSAAIQIDKECTGNQIYRNSIKTVDFKKHNYAIFQGDKAGKNHIHDNSIKGIGKVRADN